MKSDEGKQQGINTICYANIRMFMQISKKQRF